jgi:hypothetical protein
MSQSHPRSSHPRPARPAPASEQGAWADDLRWHAAEETAIATIMEAPDIEMLPALGGFRKIGIEFRFFYPIANGSLAFPNLISDSLLGPTIEP